MSLDQIIPGLIGLLVFGIPTVYFIRLYILGQASRNWSTTSGIITIAHVKKLRRNNASAQIRYQYQVDGQDYTGSTVCFGDFINTNSADARATVLRYGVGNKVIVYYHPGNPAIATLEPRASKGVLMAIVIGLGAVGSILWGLATGS